MVNRIFKGDVAEISWGKETGLFVQGTGANTGFRHDITYTDKDSSKIIIGTASYWVDGGGMKLPDNALVGCVVRINANAVGSGFSGDDFATTKRTFYIVASDTTNSHIIVQPRLASGGVTGAFSTSTQFDSLVIDTVRCPTVDTGMTDASQGVKTDQFFGLLDNFSLPEPDIDVRMQHVIGMGRDVNVLTSGKETLTGGSFTANAHNFRWMKYGLGGHTTISQGEFIDLKIAANNGGFDQINIRQHPATANYTVHKYGTTQKNPATQYTANAFTFSALNITDGGACLVGGTTTTGTTNTCVFSSPLAQTHNVVPPFGGVYKCMNQSSGITEYGTFTSITGGNQLDGTADLDTPFNGPGSATAVAQSPSNAVYVLAPLAESIKRGDVRVKLAATIVAQFAAGDYINIIDGELHTIPGQDAATTSRQIPKHELRRVIGIEGDFLYVEEPFFFAHNMGTLANPSSCGVERMSYGQIFSPTIDNTTKELKFGVSHTLFGDTSLPTFMIEQSFRRDDASPGTEQLLRYYNGCKVQSIGFSANTEGEVKLQVDYEAGRHYTDTAGVCSPKRMFEDIADTAINRSVSGIAIGGEKPYLFQDMNISVFGTTVLRATQVNFGLTNSNETRHYIRGYAGNTVDTDQVQQAAVQMPMDYTEAKREYTFSFSAIIEDDQLWNQMRTRKHHENVNDIVMTFKKVGSNSTRENATITIEDYTIKKADHQIPDSKGAVVVDVELIVRHLKVVENSVYLGY